MADAPDSEIIADVIDTLKAIEVGGKSLARVIVIDSAEGFIKVANTFDGPVAGIIAGRAQRDRPGDSGEEYRARLEIPIVVLMPGSAKIGPAGDVQELVNLVNDWVDAIRAALLVDPWRSGNAHLIDWKGRTIGGTNVDGEPRWVKHKAGDGVLAQQIPVAVGYRKSTNS